MKKLKKLLINNCRLISLPKGIGNLSSLESINVDSNKIKELPEEIGNLKNLEILDVKIMAALK